jgi:hypothetical protein
MSSIIDTLLNDYKKNTLGYDKLSKEEKRIVELQGKMEHTHLEYQRESYVYAVLNIITIVTAISAYKYLTSK